MLKAALSLALPIMILLVNDAAWAVTNKTEEDNPNLDGKLRDAWGDTPNKAYYGIFWYNNVNETKTNSTKTLLEKKAYDSLPGDKKGTSVLTSITDENKRAYGGKAVSTVNATQIDNQDASNDWTLTRTSGKAITDGNILYLNGTNNLSSIRGGGKLYSSRWITHSNSRK